MVWIFGLSSMTRKFLSVFFLFVFSLLGTTLAGQDCLEITSAEVTTRLTAGGQFDFDASAVGGSGTCEFKLELGDPMDPASFQFVGSVSGSPDQDLKGFTTLSEVNYPEGMYIARFTYSCDGGDCDPVVEEIPFEVFEQPVILDDTVTVQTCVGGKIEFSAEAYGGSGACVLMIERRPKGVGSFQFLGSVSNGPGKKLVGSLTPNPESFPPGTYEFRYTYDCDDDAFPPVSTIRELLVTEPPQITEAELDNNLVCEGGEISYLARAMGGALDCGLEIQIKPEGASDLEFESLDIAFNDPMTPGMETVLNGQTTLPAEYTAGDYIIRFIYGCTGGACEPSERRTTLTITDEPDIAVLNLSSNICEGDALVYDLLGLCGSGACALSLGGEADGGT